MKRAAIAAILTIVVSGTVAAQKTFRASVDLVGVNVFVTDNKGVPIEGLKAEDFEVIEAGKPQAIQFFAEGDPEDAPPLHLGFLLDASGSMEEDMGDVRTSAIKFLKQMERAVDITLVDFDTEVRVARFRYEDYPRLIERIRGRKPGGMTALYDALGTYLNRAAEQMGQKILIMYTDGGDTRSAMSRNEALNVVRASDVTVYVIGYLEHQSASGKMEQRQVLTQFAEMTGGQAFFPYNLKEVDKVYEKIQKEIAARYSLGYTSADERTDGAWRKVEVRLKRPDLKGVKVRTRDGYFAPYRQRPASSVTAPRPPARFPAPSLAVWRHRDTRTAVSVWPARGMMNLVETGPEREWLAQWRRAGAALDRVRADDLARLDDAAALAAADTLLAIGATQPLPADRVAWSGLIDLQRQLRSKR